MGNKEFEICATLLHKIAGRMSNVRGATAAIKATITDPNILAMKQTPLSNLTVNDHINILDRDISSIMEIVKDIQLKMQNS